MAAKHIILLLLLGSINATAGESWTSPDKRLHFGVSIALGAFATGVAGQTPIENPAFGGFIACTAVGALKEGMDRNGSGTASWKDFGADVAGCAVGSLIGKTWFIEPLPKGATIGRSWRY